MTMKCFSICLVISYLIPVIQVTHGEIHDKLFFDDNPRLPYSECREIQINVFCLGVKDDLPDGHDSSQPSKCIEDRNCETIVFAIRRASGILWMIYIAPLPQIDDTLPNRVYFMMRNASWVSGINRAAPYRLHDNMVAISGAGSTKGDVSGLHAILVSDPTAPDGVRAIPGGGPKMFAKNVSGSFYPIEDPNRKWNYFAFTSGDVISYPPLNYTIDLLTFNVTVLLVTEQQFDKSIHAWQSFYALRLFTARTFLPMERLPYKKCAATRSDFFCIGAKNGATAFPEGSGCLVTRDCDVIFYSETKHSKTTWVFLVATPKGKKRRAAYFALTKNQMPSRNLSLAYRFPDEQAVLFSYERPEIIYHTSGPPLDTTYAAGINVTTGWHNFIPANGDNQEVWRNHNFTTPAGMFIERLTWRVNATLNVSQELWPLLVIEEDYYDGTSWSERSGKPSVHQSPRAIKIFASDRPPITTTQAPITPSTTEDPDEEETTDPSTTVAPTTNTTVASTTPSKTNGTTMNEATVVNDKSTTDSGGGQDSSSGKWIGITFAILAVLIVAGAVAYFVLKRKPETAATTNPQPEAEAISNNNGTGSVAIPEMPSAVVTQPVNTVVQEAAESIVDEASSASSPDAEVITPEDTKLSDEPPTDDEINTV